MSQNEANTDLTGTRVRLRMAGNKGDKCCWILVAYQWVPVVLRSGDSVDLFNNEAADVLDQVWFNIPARMWEASQNIDLYDDEAVTLSDAQEFETARKQMLENGWTIDFAKAPEQEGKSCRKTKRTRSKKA